MSSGSSDLVRAALIALVCLPLVSTLHAAGVFAQPANFYLTADAGSNVESEFSLSPTGDGTAVSISLAPFTLDEHGQPRSCQCRMDRTLAGWGDVSAHRLSLTSGRREIVGLRLSVPASAKGSYWGVVMVDVEQPQQQRGLEIKSRIAIPVFVTVRGTEAPAVRLTELTAFKTGPREIVVGSTVVNEGNMILHAAPVIVVETGAVSAPVELASLEDAVVTVLPEGRRVFRLTIRGDFRDPAQLRVTAWLRFGNGAAAVTEATCAVAAAPPCDSPNCLGT